MELRRIMQRDRIVFYPPNDIACGIYLDKVLKGTSKNSPPEQESAIIEAAK